MRQGSVATEGEENATLQQMMKTIRALQPAVAASRVNQYRFQVDLAVSQASNKELCKTNEELYRSLQQVGKRAVDERGPPIPPRAHPMPFSQEIMDVVILATSMGPKVTFTGVEDLEAHPTAFHTQMMLSGGSDVVYCKLFMSTLAGATLGIGLWCTSSRKIRSSVALAPSELEQQVDLNS